MSRDRVAILIAAQIVTLILGLGLLAFVVAQGGQERIGARRDSCVLIVGLARAAAGNSPRALAAANAYIARTQLHDCNAYAHHPTVRRVSS